MTFSEALNEFEATVVRKVNPLETIIKNKHNTFMVVRKAGDNFLVERIPNRVHSYTIQIEAEKEQETRKTLNTLGFKSFRYYSTLGRVPTPVLTADLTTIAPKYAPHKIQRVPTEEEIEAVPGVKRAIYSGYKRDGYECEVKNGELVYIDLPL